MTRRSRKNQGLTIAQYDSLTQVTQESSGYITLTEEEETLLLNYHTSTNEQERREVARLVYYIVDEATRRFQSVSSSEDFRQNFALKILELLSDAEQVEKLYTPIVSRLLWTGLLHAQVERIEDRTIRIPRTSLKKHIKNNHGKLKTAIPTEEIECFAVIDEDEDVADEMKQSLIQYVRSNQDDVLTTQERALLLYLLNENNSFDYDEYNNTYMRQLKSRAVKKLNTKISEIMRNEY